MHVQRAVLLRCLYKPAFWHLSAMSGFHRWLAKASSPRNFEIANVPSLAGLCRAKEEEKLAGHVKTQHMRSIRDIHQLCSNGRQASESFKPVFQVTASRRALCSLGLDVVELQHGIVREMTTSWGFNVGLAPGIILSDHCDYQAWSSWTYLLRMLDAPLAPRTDVGSGHLLMHHRSRKEESEQRK